MATWAQFRAEAPDAAAIATQLWSGITALDHAEELPHEGNVFTIAYLGTIRADGGPRVHPFCPILADGRLFAAIPRSSPKGFDLRRDPRCVIHALPGSDDDELFIRARATEVTDDATRALVGVTVERSDVAGMIESVSVHALFEFDLEQVDVARWLNIGKAGTRAVRLRWRATPA